MNFLTKYFLGSLKPNKVCSFKNTRTSIQIFQQFCSKTNQNSSLPHPKSVEALQELFSLKKSTAFNIILDHATFAEVSKNDIKETFNSCIKAGIEKHILHEQIQVLSMLQVEEKIQVLKELPHDINITVALLTLNFKLLKKFVEQEKNEKRIEYLSNIFLVNCLKIVSSILHYVFFQLNAYQVCVLLSLRSFLITLDLQHIEKCCKILTGK